MKFFLSLLLLSLLNTVFGAALERRAAIIPNVNGNVINLSPNGGTYPRITPLRDGSVLASYTAFDGPTHILTVARSTDGGKTFSFWGEVTRGTNDVDNLHLGQLPNGNIIATFRNNDKNGSNYTYYRITACVSSDNGRTWRFLSQVLERGANGINGLWEPFNRIARDGSLQVYFAAENAGNDQDILMRQSYDGGATWGPIINVAGGSTTGRDGMPACTDFNDGNVKTMCIFETTEGTGFFTVKSVVSADDGRTWYNRREVFRAGGNQNNAGAPAITTTTGGALVASFMTDEDTSLHHWVDGSSLKILTAQPSESPGWGFKTTISGVQSSWPTVQALRDGSVLACADNGGPKCHSVTFS